MPRIADPGLHDRILDAACDLLRRKNVEAITLRSVAEQAQTTTPTVYKRFRDKDELIKAVAERIRHRFMDKVMAQSDVHEAIKMFLREATAIPQDYRLFYELDWPRLFPWRANRPMIEWTCRKLAEMHGGSPDTYRDAVLCLWMELHGAATLIAIAPDSPLAGQLQKACLHTCATIVANPRLFLDGNGRGPKKARHRK